MRRIGFVISGKENERRRAILPTHLEHVEHRSALVLEQGYGEVLGIPDSAYRAMGCSIAPREEVYRCEVICNPKAPETAEMELFGSGQTYFGWAHAVQGRAMVDFLLDREMSAIAWEDMYEGGRHSFWRNNEIAGEAAVLHAINFLGRLPSGLTAAVIGRGNCAMGAINALAKLGVSTRVYDRKTVSLLPEELDQYDLVVNAVMWDIFRSDHLLTRSDLSKMRPGSMIIDVSCDEGMGIESSRPTPIYDPVYELDGIIHYVVDHTPALYYRTATEEISRVVVRFLDKLVMAASDECLDRATVVRDGRIIDERISRFQGRTVPLWNLGSQESRSSSNVGR